MPRPLSYVPFCLLFFAFHLSLSAQDLRIDGCLDDWAAVERSYIDIDSDDQAIDTDIISLQLAHSEAYFFLSFKLMPAIALQKGSTMTLAIDTDNSAATGRRNGRIGVDLEWNFGTGTGYAFADGQRAGLRPEDIGLVIAPSMRSDRFELAIDRDARVFDRPLLRSPVCRLYLQDSDLDALPDDGDSLLYDFSGQTIAAPYHYSLEKEAPEHLRLLSYNVHFDALFEPERRDAFRRIFRTLQADVIGLQELYEHDADQVEELFTDWLPPESGFWSALKIVPDLVLVTRHTIRDWRYIGPGAGAFHLDLAAPFNSEALLILVHAACCDKDVERQALFDELMAFLRDTYDGRTFALQQGAPVILMGDFNLVGDPDQYQSLLKGTIFNSAQFGPSALPDWKTRPLIDRKPRLVNAPLAHTWLPGGGSSFTPGRLDYVFYSGSALTPGKAFVLETTGMHADSLQRHRLLSSDTDQASDHLPLVADFALRNVKTGSVVSPRLPATPLPCFITEIAPQPLSGTSRLTLRIRRPGNVRIEIIDTHARFIVRLEDRYLTVGEHRLAWDGLDHRAAPATTGIYFCRVIHESQVVQSLPLLVLRQ